MKKIQIAILLLIFSTAAFAQLGINTDGSDPDASAMLDVKSTDKGVLIPRMSQSQRNGISSPQEGLMIYQNSGTKGFYYFNGAAWTLVGDGVNDADANPSNELQTISASGGASPAISLNQGGGSVNLAAGTNVSLAQSGNTVTINSTAGGGGAGFTVNINGSPASNFGLTYAYSPLEGEHVFVSAQGYLVLIDNDDRIEEQSVYYSELNCSGTAVISDGSNARGQVVEIGDTGNLGYVPKNALRTTFIAKSFYSSNTSTCATSSSNREDDFILTIPHNSATTGITLNTSTNYIVTWN